MVIKKEKYVELLFWGKNGIYYEILIFFSTFFKNDGNGMVMDGNGSWSIF